MGLGDFMQVDIDRFWLKDFKQAENLATIPGYRPAHPELLDGLRHYREAYRAFHMNSQEPDYVEKAQISLRKAVRAYPADGNLWVQAGQVAFKLREFQEAKSCFEEAKKRVLSKHVSDVCNLYLARCLDIAGERRKALEIYSLQASVEEPRLREAFRRGSKKRYREKETSRMLIDLQFPDTFHY